MPVFVTKCICTNDFQDKIYGLGNRVHNAKMNGNEGVCTVCGKVNPVKSKASSTQTHSKKK